MSDDDAHPDLTGENRLPGDPTPGEAVERMIRVDHAGEYGAVRIYAGQRAVLRGVRLATGLAGVPSAAEWLNTGR